MNAHIDFLSLIGDRANLKLLHELHNALLSTAKNVEYRIFPIYIRYADVDKNIALLYYKGKHLKPGELELGLNIGEIKRPKGFDSGKRMKYPGINCGIKLSSSVRLTKRLTDAINLTIKK
jgi:hypothetical protein